VFVGAVGFGAALGDTGELTGLGLLVRDKFPLRDGAGFIVPEQKAMFYSLRETAEANLVTQV
jgi:hypothetical protein